MSDDVIRHCMEPYFSTKERGESTGMGLAFSHGLVTGAGGRVELGSHALAWAGAVVAHPLRKCVVLSPENPPEGFATQR